MKCRSGDKAEIAVFGSRVEARKERNGVEIGGKEERQEWRTRRRQTYVASTWKKTGEEKERERARFERDRSRIVGECHGMPLERGVFDGNKLRS